MNERRYALTVSVLLLGRRDLLKSAGGILNGGVNRCSSVLPIVAASKCEGTLEDVSRCIDE